jgi:hypothetical protein
MMTRLRLRPAWPPRRPAGLAWGLWASTLLGLALAAWLGVRSGQSDITGQERAGLAAVILMVAATMSAATVGAVLASRRPAHPVGWLLVAIGLRLVDRRFNGRYDAARTVTAFSARLREEIDLDTLTGELLAVVEETVQPTRTSLWLRPRRA